MRKRLFALGALGCCIFAGAITTAPAVAQDNGNGNGNGNGTRDGSFSCRASAVRISSLEPIKAGDNTKTVDPLDASDPCEPGKAGLSDYTGPTGCYLVAADPNCTNPFRTSVGALYATTEECQPNYADPTIQDNCHSTPGIIDFAKKSTVPADGDGVKARAGVADLFLAEPTTNPVPPSGAPPARFLHLSTVNSFAEVTCRPNGPNGTLIPVWDARSQVVFINFSSSPPGTTPIDVVPGLIPPGGPPDPPGAPVGSTPNGLNTYQEFGPFRFNVTYANHNEPGGKIGPSEGIPQPLDGPEGAVNTTDADRSTKFVPVTRITQRAVEFSGGTIVAGEATVDAGDVSNGAKIIIKKDSRPDDDQDFTFAGKNGVGDVKSGGDNPCGTNGGDGFASFKLDDDNKDGDDDEENENHENGDEDRGDDDVDEDGVGDGDDETLPNSRTFSVKPGTYTVSEAAVDGWTLENIRCVDSSSANSRGDAALGTAMINVDDGETVTCTFVNKKDRHKPPKCDKDGDKHDDHDGDHNGWHDGDRNHDGRDDRDGRDLRNGRDNDRNGEDDECERERNKAKKSKKGKKKEKCSKHAKKSAKKSSKKSGKRGGKDDDDDDRGGKKDRGGDKDDRGKGKDKDKGKQCKSKKNKKGKKAKRSKKR